MDNEFSSSEDIKEWIEIESTDKNEWQNIDNPLIIRENFFDDSAVFPPGNHENLSITTSKHPNDQHAEEPRQLPPSSSDSAEKIKRKCTRWKTTALGILNNKLGKLKLFASAAPAGVGAIALLLLLYVKFNGCRKQVQYLQNEHLMLLIKEKDQKINQLLFQIARLNDMLLASRKVPVLRVH